MDPWCYRDQVGVDEVGIGPLAGPVVAAAVVLDSNRPIAGLTDSKKLTRKKREALSAQIREQALCWSIGSADEDEIDRLNILRASHLAMQRAVAQLAVSPGVVFVDGNKTPQFAQPCIAVVKGDLRMPAISAASILAKVHRDAHMTALDMQYPGYGFASNMGYPTRAHFQALQQSGATPVHRQSFAPVREVAGLAPRQTTLNMAGA
ncbi:MAG: ribonuclease HII [Pseudomonadota bacterium]